MVIALILIAAVSCTTETPTPAANSGSGPSATQVSAQLTAAPAAVTASQAEASPMATLPAGSTVEVLGVWGSTELESFQAMVAPWQEQTGGQMNFTGTRDLTAVLTTRIQAGNPPDVAILPNPGLVKQFATAGDLQPLGPMLDMTVIDQQYSAAWLDLGTVNGDVYALPSKATNKGIIWYNPNTFTTNGWDIPSTWEEMISLSDSIVAAGGVPANPWSVGAEAGQASGFAATDWIAQIFLTKYGGDAYDQWVNHEIPWTDPRIQDAWEMFGTIVNTEGYVPGGATAALATNFQDAAYLPFTDPPGAAMYYEGDFVQGFITAQFPDLVAGEDYNFFAFPSISEAATASATPTATAEASPSASAEASPTAAAMETVVTGGADLVVAFKDTPAIRSLISYLATPAAQTIWVERGGFTSVNSEVSLSDYPDPIAMQSAEMLVNATVFRFGAGDIMPGAMQTAWWAATLQYLQTPGALESILASLESTANTAYTTSPTPSASPTATESPSTTP
jgi:alpha-glucoside transport system substrate-binding protein